VAVGVEGGADGGGQFRDGRLDIAPAAHGAHAGQPARGRRAWATGSSTAGLWGGGR
jgi:hypothetical protein